MTHVWPVFGEAPAPSFVSSYWRPEGVVFICDSFFAAVALFSSAGAENVRRANAAQVNRADGIFFIECDSFRMDCRPRTRASLARFFGELRSRDASEPPAPRAQSRAPTRPVSFRSTRRGSRRGRAPRHPPRAAR